MHSNPNWNSNIVDNYAPIGNSWNCCRDGSDFIAFEGYEIIVQTGEEVKNPKKNIPRAIFISLTLVVVIVLSCSICIYRRLFSQTQGNHAWNIRKSR